MKHTTEVRAAVRLAAVAICHYHKTVHSIGLRPTHARVEWLVGKGWLIDHVLFPGTAEQVINHFDKLQRRWNQKTLDYEAGLVAAKTTIAPPDEVQP